MTIENNGNIPSEISYGRIESKEKDDDFLMFSDKFHFNFTYT